MFRKVLALGLFASLLLSGMFFSPAYKAEESEEFYEDQPYLYYDLHIDELDSKHIEKCINDSDYRIHNYCHIDFDFPESITLTCLGGDAGCLDTGKTNENTTYYHDPQPFNQHVYTSENAMIYLKQRDSYYSWRTAPAYGEFSSLNSSNPEHDRYGSGWTDLYCGYKAYVEILDCYTTDVLSGNPNVRHYASEVNWGDEPDQFYPDFSGSVYMRREYSSAESEQFRELMVKSYKISMLDKEYTQNIISILNGMAEGTIDSEEGLETISNITSTYDGKAKMFLNYTIAPDEIITLDMITWVRDNFDMNSLLDGVPRGVMSKRLDNVNTTIKSEEDLTWKLDVIENEIMREHYERDIVTKGGPTLEIDGVQAVWSNWEFESVGPTSHLIGGVSSQKDNRLWIGQWMHIDFPNATHTPGNHTLKFEWPDEDFTGKETNFHVSLGYGDVFKNVATENLEKWEDDRIKNPNWFGFNAKNGTVGTFEATFGQGFTDYETYDWFEAAEYAESLTYQGVNGHLATITSKEEAKTIFSLLDGQAYWIGGFHNMDNPNYSEPSGGWEWVTGENFSNDFWGEGEPNEAGPEDCLEIWGFDKFVNDNRCHMGWMGMVVEYEMNGTNHYEALIPQWEWDEKNGTDILTYVNPVPLTDKERNDILKEEGDPDADDDGIVDTFDTDDDNDGIDDEADMDDDNDGIDDDNDRCPGTKVGDQVDEDGCSASQIIGELSDSDGSLPSLSFVVSIIAVLGLAILRKPRL